MNTTDPPAATELSSHPAHHQGEPKARSRGLGMTGWIMIGLVVGVAFGWLAPPEWSAALKPLAKVFIRLIKMIVSPLVFASLVVGLAGAGSQHVGRLLLKSLLWFWLATSVALLVGLGAANTLQPGRGAHQSAQRYEGPRDKPKSLLEQLVPESAIAAAAENSVLQLVFFSVLFGVGLSALGPRGQPLLAVLQVLSDTMFKVTELVMRFAPIGVGAAMAAAVGAQGPGVLVQLGRLVLSLYVALVVFSTLLLLAAWRITRFSPLRLLRALREPLFLAFSTTSSESALPKAMEIMTRLGVPKHIVGFVIPAGYSFNLDGTTLYLALASLFIAQGAGVSMTLSQQLIMMLTLLLTSKGVAAVPRASLVVLAATCQSFNLPIDWIATILGVDALMDMARTTVNVLGNCVASAVVARWEGLLPAEPPAARSAGALA